MTKKILLTLILSMVLITFTCAVEITSGDSYIVPFSFTEDFAYYKIFGNTTPIDLNVTQNGSVVTIEFSKYMKSDEFEITFYNYKNEQIAENNDRGGTYSWRAGFSSGKKTIPKDEVIVSQTIIEDVNENKDIVSMEPVDTTEENKSTWIFIYFAIIIMIIGLGVYFYHFFIELKGGTKKNE